MGKYRTNSTIRQKPKSEGPHPIWRGIGCIMILIIPAISIKFSSLTINYGLANKWTIPYQLLGAPKLPDLVYKSTGLMTIFSPILKIQNFYAIAALSLFYMVVISGLISVIYAFVYQMTAPSRFGPTDAPPPKFKPKKYTR